MCVGVVFDCDDVVLFEVEYFFGGGMWVVVGCVGLVCFECGDDFGLLFVVGYLLDFEVVVGGVFICFVGVVGFVFDWDDV